MLKELYVVKLNDRNGVVEVIQSPGEISIRKLGEMQFFFNKPFVLISISWNKERVYPLRYKADIMLTGFLIEWGSHIFLI